MHLLSSLITFLAFALFASVHASPVPFELPNAREISDVAVRNENTNFLELYQRNEPSVFGRAPDVIEQRDVERRSPMAGGGDWKRGTESAPGPSGNPDF